MTTQQTNLPEPGELSPLPLGMDEPEVAITESLLIAAVNELRRFALPAGADDQVILNLEAAIAADRAQRVKAEPVAQVGEAVAWRPMSTAPKDGTIVRLLVEFEDHALDDEGTACVTIGGNTYDNHKDFDEWKFAGWDWCQDEFRQGVGKPIGWLPLLDGPQPASVASEAVQPLTDEQSELHRFLDAAAGEGLVLDGVDAADLYAVTFPEIYASKIAAHGIGKETP